MANHNKIDAMNRVAAVLAVSIVLSGCSAGANVPLARSAQSAAHFGTASKHSPKLYVGTGQWQGNIVNVYTLGSKRLDRSIHFGGAEAIAEMAVDGAGDIYLPLTHGAIPGGVCVVPIGATRCSNLKQTSKVLSVVPSPASSDMYVGMLPGLGGRGPGSIDVYSSGSRTPSRSIHNVIPYGMAFDANGNLYVETAAQYASGSVYIAVYPAGASQPASTIQLGPANLGPMALDRAGTLFVSKYAWNSTKHQNDFSIAVYPTGASAPSYTISGLTGGVGVLAISPHGDLYVSNCGSTRSGNCHHPEILVYPPGGTSPAQTIPVGKAAAALSALVFDPSGNLYVLYNAGKTDEVMVFRNGTKFWYSIPQAGASTMTIGPG
jgi:hypothetical protein